MTKVIRNPLGHGMVSAVQSDEDGIVASILASSDDNLSAAVQEEDQPDTDQEKDDKNSAASDDEGEEGNQPDPEEEEVKKEKTSPKAVENNAMRERDRIAAIIRSPSASSCSDLAQYLAFETNISVACAVGALDVVGKAQPQTVSSGFDEAMANVDQPAVGSAPADPASDDHSLAMSILNA